MTKNRSYRLGSMIWYQAVEYELGLAGPSAVEMQLEGDRLKPDLDGVKRPRKWRQYCQGKRTPADNPGPLNVIDIAERAAPGTARWFRTPLWRVLNGDFETPDALLQLVRERPKIACIVESSTEQMEYEFPEGDDHSELKGLAPIVKFETDRICECLALEGLDLLEAIVFLLELGSLSRKAAISSRALKLYELASSKIADIPQLGTCLVLFFGAIEGRYANNNDVPVDDKFPPWHIRMPELNEQIYDFAAMQAEAQRL